MKANKSPMVNFLDSVDKWKKSERNIELNEIEKIINFYEKSDVIPRVTMRCKLRALVRKAYQLGMSDASYLEADAIANFKKIFGCKP